MKEILPGLYHYTAFHERIRMDVSSYYAAEARALIDPMLPEEGLEWFRGEREPQMILLTNRHHYRKSAEFVEAFGCPVLCNEAGLHEFEGGPNVKGFAVGDEVAPGIVVHDMGAICPDDSVLHIHAGQGVLAFADALVRWGDSAVGVVPDQLMDDPPKVKEGIRASARRLSELPFDTLLFAHGDPIVGEGKQALLGFLER
jgi:hypothetical protein